MKQALAAAVTVLAMLLPSPLPASTEFKAEDINDFTVRIAKDVAGFLKEAGASEVAVVPFKNAESDEEYALSEVLTGQILQELRFSSSYAVIAPEESSSAFRVTGVWQVEGETIKVVTRIVKMPAGEVDITYTGTIPLRRVPKVYIAKGDPRPAKKDMDRGVRIAIMDFEGYESYPKLNYLSTSIPETITTTFARQSNLVLVERLQMEKIMGELNLAESEYVDPEAVVELGKLLGANYVIIGSFHKASRKVRLRARRVKVETSEIFEAVGVIGKESDIFELEEELAKALLDDIQKYR